MSQETFEIVTSRKIEEVQLQLALQCAPLIAGSDISWYVLLHQKARMMVLLYHEESLKRYLAHPEVRKILEEAGYPSMEFNHILKEFCGRYERYMEPFVSEVCGFASGKTIALFGSYGWGDGQWMRDWVDRMNSAGATVLNGEGVICQEIPDEVALAECENLGKQLAGV